MTEEIKKMLEGKQQHEKIGELTTKIKDWMRTSRSKMSEYYPRWNRNLKVYRAVSCPDNDDFEADKLDKAAQSVVPMSYAQVQVFTAFCFLLLTQNKNFFSLEGTGDEDFSINDLIEKGLSRDLRHNKFNVKLYQFLLDISRCSIGVFKNWWTVDTQLVDVTSPFALENTPFGEMVSELPAAGPEEMIKFEGNKLRVVSPFKIFPDLRKPLTNWEEGQFICDEDEWHISNVKLLEKKGLAVGTEFIQRMTKDHFKDRKSSNYSLGNLEASFKSDDDKGDFMVCHTEGNIRIVPKDYNLGDGDVPRLYVFSMDNDRMTRLELAGSLHDEFGYSIGQFSHDQEQKLSECLSDVINALQEMITFLYNSRFEAVQQSLDKHLVVNPSFIDTSMLESRSSVVYTLKNAPNVDIGMYVKQLEVKDTTAKHFEDANYLLSTMQVVTGVNDNAMGQVAQGRRSATENRAANAGAASRMKMILGCLWDSCFGPLGRKMMINQRQGISFETFVKIFGEDPETLALFDQYAPSDPTQLVGNEDFFVLDTVMNSEKGFIAQSLQELLGVMMSNPEMTLASGFDPEKVTLEIQRLRGTPNAKRFFTRPVPPPVPPAGLPGNPAVDPSVVPQVGPVPGAPAAA